MCGLNKPFILCFCRLKALKARIQASRMTAPLFNTQLYTQNLERLFYAMWDRHEKGLPPDHITSLSSLS